MAHNATHGTRHGVRRGPTRGLPLSGGMAGVAQDATSGKFAPETAGQWTTTLSAAGIGSGGPTSVWLCQEASGNLADSLGGVTLTQSGAGHLYAQNVTGWSRKAVVTTDGTVGQKWINNTTAANPATTDTLVLAYLGFPGVAPAAQRDVLAEAAAADIRLNTSGKVRAVFGASTDLASSALGRVMPVVMKVDNTGAISAAYSDQDKLIDTYVLPASAALFTLGGQTAAAASVQYLYCAQFRGAAARLTDAQIKSLLQTLNWTVLWS